MNDTANESPENHPDSTYSGIQCCWTGQWNEAGAIVDYCCHPIQQPLGDRGISPLGLCNFWEADNPPAKDRSTELAEAKEKE